MGQGRHLAALVAWTPWARGGRNLEGQRPWSCCLAVSSLCPSLSLSFLTGAAVTRQLWDVGSSAMVSMPLLTFLSCWELPFHSWHKPRAYSSYKA